MKFKCSPVFSSLKHTVVAVSSFWEREQVLAAVALVGHQVAETSERGSGEFRFLAMTENKTICYRLFSNFIINSLRLILNIYRSWLFMTTINMKNKKNIDKCSRMQT